MTDSAENIEQDKSPEQGELNQPGPEPVAPAAAVPEPVADPAPVEPAQSEEPIMSEEPAKAEEPVQPKAKAQPKIIEGERKWYVIQTLTGQEDKAKSALEQTIVDEGLKDRVFQILVPLEETVEIKNGKRYDRVRKMFPGYVFVDMILDEETWYLIRQTSGVARFIGSKVKPTPVSEKEMARVLKQLGKEERLEVSFERGEGVRVISGAFRGYTGSVDEINEEKGKLKVLINIFGRDTPVEVNFEHAQKIN
jgi:transcription termination/antitermination protein NusG